MCSVLLYMYLCIVSLYGRYYGYDEQSHTSLPRMIISHGFLHATCLICDELELHVEQEDRHRNGFGLNKIAVVVHSKLY